MCLLRLLRQRSRLVLEQSRLTVCTDNTGVLLCAGYNYDSEGKERGYWWVLHRAYKDSQSKQDVGVLGRAFCPVGS